MKLRIHFDNGNVMVLENVIFVSCIEDTIMINQKNNNVTTIKKSDIRSIRLNSFNKD